MDLILTHDNADFDAVASQLAAHRLTPTATPILPSRQNRNVRHFLTLYWDELPFWKMSELPRKPVNRAIVVDTQHFQTVRGMSAKTAIQIVDHHPRSAALNPDWQVTTDPVGANTTLLVERIQSASLAISTVEATLLTLGIYEDTGSLTYGTTTSRDAYAAAWLLAQSARLDVVREFLHHPLADDQQALYERLVENAQTHDIAGHPVVIASASAPDLVEEIATLAHRLRDLLEPAAVFLLVKLERHIQLVARSTTDAVDVGEIAGRFGGGGHSRAAAAILHHRSLAKSADALLKALHESVRPGLTVADLMSHGVQTLSPQTRVRDADARMRRYGYEGFPVVDEGRIVGLLTRRAVDRAMDHGLTGVRIHQLMEAGSVSAHPSDSISALQHIMMTSGWGQVPVVDDAGKVIGVVTRTDLIKHIGRGAPPPPTRRADLIALLESALPPGMLALAHEAGRIAHELGLRLYVVGGVVRDLLLGQPVTDVDFVVEGDAIALTRALCAAFGGEMRSHDRFGTGKWLLDDGVWQAVAKEVKLVSDDIARLPRHVDFVTARTEYYRSPSELPEVERSGIKHDLHRRDFTINTLALRLDPSGFGTLLDFYGGESDLWERRIRVLHSLSFVDDPTRILRAVRLEQRLGFQIGPRTSELIQHALPLLERVSGDRIRHEIELILDEDRPELALCRLEALGVLRFLHPALTCDERMSAAFADLRRAAEEPVWPELAGLDLELPYYATLTLPVSWEAAHAVSRRIRVQRRTLDMLEKVHALKPALESLTHSLRPSQVDELLSGADDRVLVTLWAAAHPGPARDQIAVYASQLRHMMPQTDGAALKGRGLRPGPHFGAILRDLRSALLDGEITSPE